VLLNHDSLFELYILYWAFHDFLEGSGWFWMQGFPLVHMLDQDGPTSFDFFDSVVTFCIVGPKSIIKHGLKFSKILTTVLNIWHHNCIMGKENHFTLVGDVGSLIVTCFPWPSSFNRSLLLISATSWLISLAYLIYGRGMVFGKIGRRKKWTRSLPVTSIFTLVCLQFMSHTKFEPLYLMFYVVIQLKHCHIWIWCTFNSSRTDKLLHITNNRGVVITIINMFVFQNK